jgi:hypothetical protein
MDGGGSKCIEEGLQNGWRKVNIRGNMKEKAMVLSSMKFLLVFIVIKLLS